MAKLNKKSKNDLRLGGDFQPARNHRAGGLQNDHTTKPTPMTALAVSGLGVYFIALGLKLLPMPPHALHGPPWTMAAIGSALFFSGICIELQCLGQVKTWLYKTFIAAVLISMLSPFVWLAFGDSNLSLVFRIAFASPFIIIGILLLPFGKTKIIPAEEGKPMSEILKDRRSEPSALQKRKLEIEENKEQKATTMTVKSRHPKAKLLLALTLASLFSYSPWPAQSQAEISPALQKAVDEYQAEHYYDSTWYFEKLCKDKAIGRRELILAHTGAASAAYQNSHIKLAMKHYKSAYQLLHSVGKNKEGTKASSSNSSSSNANNNDPDFDSAEKARLDAELTASLGDVYYEQENYKKAIQYFKDALAMSQGKKDYLEIYMRCLEGLAASYFKDKHIKESLPIYEEMAWRDRHLYGPLSTQYGWSLRVLTDVYEALKQPEKALQCFDRSVWIFRLADRDRLVAEFAGQTKYSHDELVKRLTERTVGAGTNKIDPELTAAYTGEKTPPEALPPHKSHHRSGQIHSEIPWQRQRVIMHQPAAMQWVNPDVKPVGIVVCVPGFGLHRKSFSALGQKLAEQGLLVYAYDVRGFGAYTSMKARDRIDLAKTLEDLESSLRTIRRDNPGLPIFILGESMGGSIALQLTAKHPELIDGLIAAVPSSQRFKQWKLVAKIGLSIVTGNKEPINAAPAVVNRATNDPALKHEWADDPESRFTATEEEFMAVSKFLSNNKKCASQITKTPVIMYQGVHDLLIKPEGTISLFRKIGTLDKDLSLIGRSQHLLFEQGQFSNNLLNSLSDWIKNHSTARKEPAVETSSEKSNATSTDSKTSAETETQASSQQ